MKRKIYNSISMLFLGIFMLCSMYESHAQNAFPLTFESSSEVFTTFDLTAGVVSNPDVSTLNPSSSVMEVVRSGTNVFSGGFFNFGTPFDFTTTNAITMKVYSPRTGVIIKLKVEGGVSTVELDQVTSVANEWEELVWNFAGTASDHSTLTMFFDAGQAGDGTANSTFYFDDVRIFDTTIGLPIDLESNILDYSVTDFAGSTTTFGTDPLDASNRVGISVKADGASTFAGVVVGTNGLAEAIPFTASEQKLTMRVYSPLSGIKVRMKVEDKTSGGILVEAETTTSYVDTWEQLVFDFGSPVVNTLNLANTYDKITLFFDFDVAGTVDRTYYWDDISFVSSNDLVISQNASLAGVTVNTGESLTVSNGATLTVTGAIVNNGTFRVNSGSSLITYATNSITGNDLEIRRNTRYADGKYSFVGTPVEQNSGTLAADLGSNVYTYDESQSAIEDDLVRWVLANGTDQLESARGYTQAFQKEIIFTGVPNTGTITYTGSYMHDGWHLVSNPYAAAIEINAFLDANMNTTDAVYIWDDNNSATGRGSNSDYIVANRSGALVDVSGPDSDARWNGHIGSAQGFFVKLDGSAGNITFTEGMRRANENSDDNFFRKQDNKTPLVRLNLTSQDGLRKQALLAWNNEVFDHQITEGYDAEVFNTKADYAIYTQKASTRLAIQTVTSGKTEIPLGINVAEGGTYQIEVKTENGYQGVLYLYDVVTGDRFDLMQGAYTFTSTSGQITDRFILLTTSDVLALSDFEERIYTFEKTLYIQSKSENTVNYHLYNLSGKHVLDAEVTGSRQLDLSNLPTGIYLVSDGVASKKVILK